MRKFLVLMTTSHATIDADTITFESGHVCFWKSDVMKREDGCWMDVDRLVRAIHNPAVEEVKEIEDE